MSFQAKNILVTGGAGFIGCNYIRNRLALDKQCQIINLDLLTYAGDGDNLVEFDNHPQYKFIQGDICDVALINKILAEHHVDTIIHFAAESHVDRSIAKPQAFVETNILGTFTLLQAAEQYWLQQQNLNANQCRFHHISTDEVYGSLTAVEPAFTEKTAYHPNSPYSASKASSDHLVNAYYHTYGLPITISNCSNNFGPYQHSEKFIPTVITSCFTQQPIPVYGDGSNIRDWLYVIDHCNAIDTIIAKGDVGESYNVGGDNEIANLAMVEKICDFFDSNYPQAASYHQLITFITDRKGHDWRYAIDNHKISKQLGWQPQYSFEVALQETIDFYYATLAAKAMERGHENTACDL